MKTDNKRSAAVLAMLLVVIFICMISANSIQHAGGTIDITEGFIDADVSGDTAQLCYKLYRPVGATEENPAPAVLLLHGYQNDHETCSAYAIELARRGAVVLAIDEYGHGSTSAGLLNRGYVNHKVTVNYGMDSAEDGTFKDIGGAVRYKIMMNFSNLSFFDDRYTKDDAGNELTDSSCGGVAAYAFMAELPFVDSSRMAVSGHSMGTWSSWSVAAAYSGTEIMPKATVLQCGELFTGDAYDSEDIKFNNVMLLQAKWDEFSYFRDYKNVVDDGLIKSPLRCEFLGTDAESAAWDTTFGSFEDGSARRAELLMTNHRLTTHNAKGLAAAIDWFENSLGFTSDIPAEDQIAKTKDVLTLAAMLCAVFAVLPVMELLLNAPFFRTVAQPLPPKEGIKKGGKWWTGAVITMLLSFATYPFMTQLGHGLLPLPEKIFRMTIGNGFLSWYLLLVIIMFIFTAAARKKESYWSIGLGTAEKPDRIAWCLMGRSALLALCMVAVMYVLVCICTCAFKLDFRFIWPFFKPFTCVRFGQFFVYILIYVLFFLFNGSRCLASSRCGATYEKGFRGFLGTWWRCALMMVGGVLLLCLLEYIPFFANIGPGADLLFGSTFGGPFMSLLIVFAPQVLVFSILCTYIYRRTGNVYTGAFTVAAMACWIVTGGSSML